MSIPQEQPTQAPYSVDNAVDLLAMFCDRSATLVARGDGMQMNDDDRAALAAAALLAIAGQMERMADAVEKALAYAISTATSPGKTHTVDWFLRRDAAVKPPFMGQDGFE